MHILVVTAAGLLALAMFYFGARLLGLPSAAASLGRVRRRSGQRDIRRRSGRHSGYQRGAFMPIFGIPAAAAWFLAFHVSR